MQKRWFLAGRSKGKLATLRLLASGVLTELLLVSGILMGCADAPSASNGSPPQVPKEQPQPVSKDLPQPLKKEVVRAWQEAGARVGWMGKTERGALVFRSEPAELARELPAFSFVFGWKEGVLTKLPDPGTPFALDLSPEVTDAVLKELAGLKSLQSLNLWETRVTDAGLKELAQLESLQFLVLGGTRVTDAGLKELVRLKDLQSLDLFDTRVTDAGLKELAELKTLQELDLRETKVTDPGVEELQKALPDCHIEH